MKMIEIVSGKVVEAAYVQGDFFWTPAELKQDGTPHGRKRGHSFKPSWICQGEYANGRFAAHDDARELKAAELRRDVRVVEAHLKQLQRALHALYAGPAPEKPSPTLARYGFSQPEGIDPDAD
jgi:hypothetical protein